MSRSTSREHVIEVFDAVCRAGMERQLLEVQSRACEIFFARYFDERGAARHQSCWPSSHTSRAAVAL